MAQGGDAAGTVLFVASTGGHLEELIRLRDRLVPRVGDGLWVTAESAQSRDLLADEHVTWLPPVAPKDWRSAVRLLPAAARLLREQSVDMVVSTGAAIAVPFALAAHHARVPMHYVESAARISGPSLSGRLCALVPGTRVYASHRSWADGAWAFHGSVFDGFEPADPVGVPAGGLRRVVVTLGTQAGYSFARALRAVKARLADVCAPDAEVLWQASAEDLAVAGVPGRALLPPSELRAAQREADLVVTHAGVGSALTALETGRCPLLLPRRRSFGEHTDDHQVEIARELAARGLAVHREVADLDAAALVSAAAARTRRLVTPADYRLAA
ncbi:glycosyltransferase [Geodermatophilus sp. URMC 61]|uniref:glycosyltransferase n=1 Tax=Geodermatophilus sp. URMC 61 TaxID=3423411 RepID=UPI00406C3D31